MKKLLAALIVAASFVPTNVSARQYVVSEIKSKNFNIKYKYNKDGTVSSLIRDAGWKSKTKFYYSKGYVSCKKDPNGKTVYTYKKGRITKSKSKKENDVYAYGKNKLLIKSVSKGGFSGEEFLKFKKGRLVERNGTKFAYDKKGFLKKAGNTKYVNTYKKGRLTKVKETVYLYGTNTETYKVSYKTVSRLSKEAKKQQNAILGKSYLVYLGRFK